MELDPKKTAVLTLDMQLGILKFVPGAEAAFAPAARVVEAARKWGYFLLHVGIGFEPGYPEISPLNQRFWAVKDSGVFQKGSEDCQVHPSLWKAGDLMVYKHRVGAFTGNALSMVLQARGIEDLVFFGISTSGIVLSTLRAAADQDFRCTVVKDACFDRDPEVHRVLTEKVFPAQGKVVTAEEFALP